MYGINFHKKGISLVELIIGMGLFALVSVTANTLLFGSLRSSRKALVVSEVKNEGAYALNAMVAQIRYAKSLISCSNSDIQLIAQDGLPLRYLFDTAPLVDRIASISAMPPLYNRSEALTSTKIAVSTTGCPGARMFTCPPVGQKTVGICFSAESATATGPSDRAGNIMFQSQATLRN